jgi:hypothetical protein
MRVIVNVKVATAGLLLIAVAMPETTPSSKGNPSWRWIDHGTLTRPIASAGPRPPALDGVYGALAGGEEQHCTSSMSREGLANVGDKIVRMLDPDRHANQ